MAAACRPDPSIGRAGRRGDRPDPGALPGRRHRDPWPTAEADRTLRLDYQAGGAYAAVDGDGEISVRLDGVPLAPVPVAHPGLRELTAHQRTERHTLELEPSSRLRIYSIQFSAGVP